MRIFQGLMACLLAFAATPVCADPATQWRDYRDSGDLDWLEADDWVAFASNYPMDIGKVAKARYYVAWRGAGDIGVMLHFLYASPVSPPELPGPGPMSTEEVEITLNCAARTVRTHRMYLYASDGHRIGMWFDPAMAANPRTYGSDSMIGKAAARVC